MRLSSRDMLRRLGEGVGIDDLCQDAGLDRAGFAQWWAREAASRLPPTEGTSAAPIKGKVRIERDAWGVPSIRAERDEDLLFGFGYALAQDRLWQMDYLRRRAAGRLAEVLGADGRELDVLSRTVGIRNLLELDLLHRTVGLAHLAEQEWGTLSAETQTLVTAFANGVNYAIEEMGERLPIEFDLLDYRPERWSPIDCLLIEQEFRWYLTGRFPVIVIPELARRVLGEGPLYRAFLEGENDSESILWPGEYQGQAGRTQTVGQTVSDIQQGEGSNNWVLSGTRTASGKPVVASDPHVPFDAVSWWYEVHLCGGSFHVAGMAYTGVPAVMFGRNERVAWGCTNNICSQRDLYQEKTDPNHPGCFLFDGRWEPWQEREEVITVRGGPSVRKVVRVSRNGPVVDDVLPPPARQTGPVSLRWLGTTPGSWLSALWALDRATSVAEARAALEAMLVPTFNIVCADVDGNIAMQSTGGIPLRKVWERGYRPGWDPEHQWFGVIPYPQMPSCANPSRGWLATANNRLAPDDFPFPLSGTWTDGLRAGRIRQMMEAQGTHRHTRQASGTMHQDALSLRAVAGVPALCAILNASPDERVQEAIRHLKAWDCRMEADRVGATLFDVFFVHWARVIVRERFDGETAALVSGGVNGLAARLLHADEVGWFRTMPREEAIGRAMNESLAWLTERLGADMAAWTWGRLHTMPLRHVLSGRGDLAQLLDQGGGAVKGDMTTVCNTGLGARFEARSGANYRLIVDLAEEPPTLWAVDASSQSGQPGSLHYTDQFQPWLRGDYHPIRLVRESETGIVLTLEPRP